MTLGLLGVIVLGGSKILTSGARFVPAERESPQVSPVIQGWLDRIKDEAVHEKKLEEANLREKMKDAEARQIPIVARTEAADDQSSVRPAKNKLAVKRPARHVKVAAESEVEVRPATARVGEFMAWRERPPF